LNIRKVPVAGNGLFSGKNTFFRLTDAFLIDFLWCFDGFFSKYEKIIIIGLKYLPEN
jgi:hypothetical protein